jgi:hypothetical protein
MTGTCGLSSLPAHEARQEPWSCGNCNSSRLTSIREIKPPGQLEVKLNGCTLHADSSVHFSIRNLEGSDLVLALEGVCHSDVDLGPIEGTILGVHSEGSPLKHNNN